MVKEDARSDQHPLPPSKVPINDSVESGLSATGQHPPLEKQHRSSLPPTHTLEKRVEPGGAHSESNQPGQHSGELAALHRAASLPSKLDGDIRDPALFAAGAKREYRKQLGLRRGGAVSPPANLRGLQVHDADLGGVLRSRPRNPRMHLANLRTERAQLQHEMTVPGAGAGGDSSLQQMWHILRQRGSDFCPAEHGHADAHHRTMYLCHTAHQVPPQYRMVHEREIAHQAGRAAKWQDIMHMQSRLGETMLRPALRQRRARQLDDEIHELEQRQRQREAAAARQREQERRPGRVSRDGRRFNPAVCRISGPHVRSARPPTTPQSRNDARPEPQGLAPSRGPRNRMLSRPSSSASLGSIPEDPSERSSPESH